MDQFFKSVKDAIKNDELSSINQIINRRDIFNYRDAIEEALRYEEVNTSSTIEDVNTTVKSILQSTKLIDGIVSKFRQAPHILLTKVAAIEDEINKVIQSLISKFNLLIEQVNGIDKQLIAELDRVIASVPTRTNQKGKKPSHGTRKLVITILSLPKQRLQEEIDDMLDELLISDDVVDTYELVFETNEELLKQVDVELNNLLAKKDQSRVQDNIDELWDIINDVELEIDFNEKQKIAIQNELQDLKRKKLVNSQVQKQADKLKQQEKEYFDLLKQEAKFFKNKIQLRKEALARLGKEQVVTKRKKILQDMFTKSTKADDDQKLVYEAQQQWLKDNEQLIREQALVDEFNQALLEMYDQDLTMLMEQSLQPGNRCGPVSGQFQDQFLYCRLVYAMDKLHVQFLKYMYGYKTHYPSYQKLFPEYQAKLKKLVEQLVAERIAQLDSTLDRQVIEQLQDNLSKVIEQQKNIEQLRQQAPALLKFKVKHNNQTSHQNKFYITHNIQTWVTRSCFQAGVIKSDKKYVNDLYTLYKHVSDPNYQTWYVNQLIAHVREVLLIPNYQIKNKHIPRIIAAELHIDNHKKIMDHKIKRLWSYIMDLVLAKVLQQSSLRLDLSLRQVLTNLQKLITQPNATLFNHLVDVSKHLYAANLKQVDFSYPTLLKFLNQQIYKHDYQVRNNLVIKGLLAPYIVLELGLPGFNLPYIQHMTQQVWQMVEHDWLPFHKVPKYLSTDLNISDTIKCILIHLYVLQTIGVELYIDWNDIRYMVNPNERFVFRFQDWRYSSYILPVIMIHTYSQIRFSPQFVNQYNSLALTYELTALTPFNLPKQTQPFHQYFLQSCPFIPNFDPTVFNFDSMKFSKRKFTNFLLNYLY